MAGFNHWGKIAKGIKPASKSVIKATAKEWQVWARAFAPMLTGFMAENIYKSGMGESDYGTGTIAPPGDSYLLPEEYPPDDMSIVVGCAANYSDFLEFGTRFMPAQPFFYPARDEANAFFEDQMSKWRWL